MSPSKTVYKRHSSSIFLKYVCGVRTMRHWFSILVRMRWVYSPNCCSSVTELSWFCQKYVLTVPASRINYTCQLQQLIMKSNFSWSTNFCWNFHGAHSKYVHLNKAFVNTLYLIIFKTKVNQGKKLSIIKSVKYDTK